MNLSNLILGLEFQSPVLKLQRTLLLSNLTEEWGWMLQIWTFLMIQIQRQWKPVLSHTLSDLSLSPNC